MDDLLREFLTETNEALDMLDVELVRFEQDPNNAAILDNIFRLVHTIKGTCGFLGLPRLECLAHAAETLMGQFRGGRPVSGEAVTLILTTIDRIKALLEALEVGQREPDRLRPRYHRSARATAPLERRAVRRRQPACAARGRSCHAAAAPVVAVTLERTAHASAPTGAEPAAGAGASAPRGSPASRSASISIPSIN